MIIEYASHDISQNDIELKDLFGTLNKFPITGVSVLPYALKLAKNIINNQIAISCPIDFPIGISDTKTRNSMVEFAAKNGASIVEMTMPNYTICNRKYDKLRDDIKSHLGLCQNLGIKIRYILEYRVFTYETLYKISQILESFGITEIYPSSGYFLDNINDNILASAMIKKKVSNINIICNGNIWHKDQIDNIIKANLYGLRVNSINGLEIIAEKILQ